jgi:tetratricopeptide (TPR) repeat protein
MQRALAAYQTSDWVEAERLCRSALQEEPDHFEALYLLGVMAGQAGRTHDAAELLSRAVSASPGYADAHYNRGVALGKLKRYAEALESYERAIALRPEFADAHFNRGVALGELKRYAEALESYERAIALRSDHAEAFNNRGILLGSMARHDEALTSYDRAIVLRPGYANAYNNRGVALGWLKRNEEALASLERAIALRPDHAEAYNNRGNVLQDLERYADALASHERAIELKPDYADAWYSRGNALRELHRHADAAESYERAIAIDPAHASAHWNLADCRLLLGDFARGWKEYEWRWKLERRDATERDFPQPLWLGEETLQDRTILLHAELGLGDTLLFCRYARQVAALGARVLLEVQPPLLALLANLEGVAQTLPRGASLPPFDYHCPLMSLPLAFRTDLHNVPASVPYVRSDPGRVAAWRARLGEKEKPRVGLVWSGSAALKNDRRSLRLEQMLPLVGDWAEWVSLQKEVPEGDVALLASRAELRHVGGQLEDFADTAALIELLDVLVTVDTSVANLAGAMGRPVWILLPFNPHDWRWALGREDSVWYPTARLFRQSAAADWAEVVRRVKRELAQRFGAAC